jgi:hypothetical protein
MLAISAEGETLAKNKRSVVKNLTGAHEPSSTFHSLLNFDPKNKMSKQDDEEYAAYYGSIKQRELQKMARPNMAIYR